MDSDATWRLWGENDPYYGVLTDPKFRKENLARNEDEFFRSGVEYVEERLDTARRCFGFDAAGRAFDFGCGVGRLTLPMAERFDSVVGSDISDAMLSEARHNAERFGRANTEFVQSDDLLTRVAGTFGFVNSYIVLQHIPVKRGMVIIDRLLAMVAPGGVAALHFSVDRQETWLQRAAYVARFRVPGGRKVVDALTSQGDNGPAMEMNEYPLSRIIGHTARLGFGACFVETEMHGQILTTKLLARRGNA